MKNSNLFVLINMLSGMGYSLAAPLFPSLGNNGELNEEILGWIISTYSLASTIFTPLVPYLTKRFSRIKLLFISTFLEATCTLLYGFLNYIHSYDTLIIVIFSLRIIHGICSSIIGILVYSLTISLASENELQLSIGNLEIGWSIGTSSGPLFVSFFYSFGGYSLPFIILGLVLYISVFIVTRINSEKLLSKEEEDSESNPSFVRFIIYPHIFIILLGLIIVTILSSYYYPCLMNHLQDNYLLSTSASSLFFIMPIISYIIILQFLDFLTSKTGIYTVISLGFLFATLFPLFLYPCPPLPKKIVFIITGFLLNGFGSAPVFTSGLVGLSKNIRKADPNTDELTANDIASAMNNLTLNIGEFVGPIIGGFFTVKYDFKYCCYIMFLVGIIYSFIFIGCFLINIKDELEVFLNLKENEVAISESDSSREGFLDSQIMSRSLQINNENIWNFKFEVISKRRNNYTIRKRRYQKISDSKYNSLMY